MDLKKLTVFLTVADYGNFTKAGEHHVKFGLFTHFDSFK